MTETPQITPTVQQSIVDYTMTAMYYRDIADRWFIQGEYLKAAQFLFQASILRFDAIADKTTTTLFEQILKKIQNPQHENPDNQMKTRFLSIVLESLHLMLQARVASLENSPKDTIKKFYQQQLELLTQAIDLISQGVKLGSCLPKDDKNITDVHINGKVAYRPYKSDDLTPLYETFVDFYTDDQKFAFVYMSRAMARTSIAALDGQKDSSQETLDDFNKSIELDPAFAEAYHRRAIFFKINGILEKSQMDYLRSAVITTPGAFEKSSRYYNGAMLLVSISQQNGEKVMSDDTLVRFLKLYDVALKEEKLAEMMHNDQRPKNIWDFKEAKEICDALYSKVANAVTNVKVVACATCGKSQADLQQSKRLQACSICKRAYYCGKECQTADWNSHKQVCKKI